MNRWARIADSGAQHRSADPQYAQYSLEARLGEHAFGKIKEEQTPIHGDRILTWVIGARRA
jgi:hypothetical protein